MGTNKSVRLVGQREIWRVYNNNSEVGANREMLNNLRVVNPNSHKIALINMPVEWGCLCAYCVVLDLAMFCVCGRVYLRARCMRPAGAGTECRGGCWSPRGQLVDMCSCRAGLPRRIVTVTGGRFGLAGGEGPRVRGSAAVAITASGPTCGNQGRGADGPLSGLGPVEASWNPK